MTQKFENLKKIENKINELCLLKKLQVEAEHRKRIKCVKTLRLFINTNVIKEKIFIRIDSRVINDFKNSEIMKFSDLIERTYIFTEEIIPTDATTENISLSNQTGKKYDSEDSGYISQCKQPGSSFVQEGTFCKNVDVYEWINQDSFIESFELRCPSSKININLVLVLKNTRNIYKLSLSLASLLSVASSTKPNLVGLLYKYVARNSLLDKNNVVKCDEALKNVFLIDSFVFTELPELLEEHLFPIDNIEFNFICNDENKFHCIDIPLEVDDLYQQPKIYDKGVYALERKIDSVSKIKTNLEKRSTIIKEFIESPINFINKWICLELEDFSNKTNVFRDDTVQEIMYDLLKGVI
ncbi:hypothetical protein NCER_101863 [Vairimorpha ceranae BRL01]|uniref:DM2 domain-containing protein n=2 Tax=Vairimorpha ceranae TaxID=40302 RepID=C4VAW7_VAIC1|nr:chc group protein [Vairimorpha ceranae]EEQ81635.1 hypothetical protein NCER_101863 [Vairimorpha ceranae BRL01]KAF5139678.1 hypothetical protein G9O61_00g021510 [Vairimorpha ceranae]KKO74425.1 chc group protein [Vairimorpha ceranae]